MTSEHQHPQRCETCEHGEKSPHVKSIYPYKCRKYDYQVHEYAYLWLGYVGCASHSSAGEQCGDNCNGECSGEVDGISHCPHSAGEPALVQKPTDGTGFWFIPDEMKRHNERIATDAAKAERERSINIVHSVLGRLSIPLSASERGVIREADVEIAESLRSEQP